MRWHPLGLRHPTTEPLARALTLECPGSPDGGCVDSRRGAESRGTLVTQLTDGFARIDAELDYVDLLDPDSLDPLPDEQVATGRTLLYLAYLVDGLRLTDTWTVAPGGMV